MGYLSQLSPTSQQIGTVDYDKLIRSYNKAMAFNDDLKIREGEIDDVVQVMIDRGGIADQADALAVEGAGIEESRRSENDWHARIIDQGLGI